MMNTYTVVKSFYSLHKYSLHFLWCWKQHILPWNPLPTHSFSGDKAWSDVLHCPPNFSYGDTTQILFLPQTDYGVQGCCSVVEYVWILGSVCTEGGGCLQWCEQDLAHFEDRIICCVDVPHFLSHYYSADSLLELFHIQALISITAGGWGIPSIGITLCFCFVCLEVSSRVPGIRAPVCQ